MRGIITQNPTLGYTGVAAAYSTEGYAWRSALVAYLRSNRELVYAHMAQHMPELRMWPMQATYLAWIDATALQWRDPVLEFERGGVGLTDGRFFGQKGYVRLNFALPR
jgi:cysteine-S-conjugate beta-lyase